MKIYCLHRSDIYRFHKCNLQNKDKEKRFERLKKLPIINRKKLVHRKHYEKV